MSCSDWWYDNRNTQDLRRIHCRLRGHSTMSDKQGTERLAGFVMDLGIVDTGDQWPPSNQGRVPEPIRQHAIRILFLVSAVF